MKAVKTWQEAGLMCTQTEIRVTNTGCAPATSMCLRVTAVGELHQSWNCVHLEDSDARGAWCFDLPTWVGPAGGLAPGASFALGIITKGADAPRDATL